MKGNVNEEYLKEILNSIREGFKAGASMSEGRLSIIIDKSTKPIIVKNYNNKISNLIFSGLVKDIKFVEDYHENI